MKKIFILSMLIMSFAASAYAANGSSALATTTVSNEGASIYGGVDTASAQDAATPLVKFSKGVKGLVMFTGTTGYMLMTKHTSGSKTFGTSNDTTSIFWTQEGPGTLVTTKAISATAANFTAGNKWTAN